MPTSDLLMMDPRCGEKKKKKEVRMAVWAKRIILTMACMATCESANDAWKEWRRGKN